MEGGVEWSGMKGGEWSGRKKGKEKKKKGWSRLGCQVIFGSEVGVWDWDLW